MSETSEREIPVTFPSFVVSLASSALVNLGEIPHPTTGERLLDLPLARHNIDLLGMLKEKTKGNLDNEESQLLDSVLYDLRMKFLQKTKP